MVIRDPASLPPAVPLGVGPVDNPRLGGRGAPDYDNALACVRCGLCLSVCPTYALERREVQSPRGRVALIRAADEGRLPVEAAGLREHLYHCLDCRACQSVCPSGVRVGELVLATRSAAESVHRPSAFEWAIRASALHGVLTSARSLGRFTPLLWLYQRLGISWLLRRTRLLHRLPLGLSLLGEMEELLPSIPRRPLHLDLPVVTPAVGERRYRVGFFLGCMMSALLRDVSEATVRVLSENGCEVVTPSGQMCCGAPHVEEGDVEPQRRFARENVDVFAGLTDLDVIVTDCAACGAELKGYAKLLGDDPTYAERAVAFAAKVRDISEFLADIGTRAPSGAVSARVTYHEPCHLAHAQGVRAQPRRVLRSVPGVEFVELAESDWCCGSAGVYNITHAARAGNLLSRKLANVAATRADVLATGNPGCLLQLRAGARQAGLPIRVAHPVQVLDEAYRRESTRKG